MPYGTTQFMRYLARRRCVKGWRLRTDSYSHFLHSRIPPVQSGPFSTGLFFDCILLVLLLIVSRVDFIVFVLFLEAVGVREYYYCCMAVENR